MTTIRTILVDSTVQFDEVVLLLYKIQYPNARSSEYPASSACINRFYETDAFLYQEYLQRDLFHQAAVRYQDSPAIARSMPMKLTLDIKSRSTLFRC